MSGVLGFYGTKCVQTSYQSGYKQVMKVDINTMLRNRYNRVQDLAKDIKRERKEDINLQRIGNGTAPTQI